MSTAAVPSPACNQRASLQRAVTIKELAELPPSLGAATSPLPVTSASKSRRKSTRYSTAAPATHVQLSNSDYLFEDDGENGAVFAVMPVKKHGVETQCKVPVLPRVGPVPIKSENKGQSLTSTITLANEENEKNRTGLAAGFGQRMTANAIMNCAPPPLPRPRTSTRALLRRRRPPALPPPTLDPRPHACIISLPRSCHPTAHLHRSARVSRSQTGGFCS